ncbi:MFS transporter [Spongisporangium articulatum]|uniref:MFS transporter n=1 Tax=Spongisporangium articulatum TaxID=3362603 RepID=A0ABW8AKA5_9ACTN
MPTSSAGLIRTDIPARLDRLPWARWHVMVLVGLGSVWILDGLEVTIVGSLGDRLTEKGSGLELTASQVGVAAAMYVTGACIGALIFGDLTERYGRRRLFMVTLGLYLAATVLTAFSTTALWFYACRFLTGAGIGGEYSAINSAIDELMPARLRGRLDLIINGSYWLGAAAGAALTLVLLDKDLFAENVGWRIAFGLGAVLGLLILVVRRNVPESPRWLSIHGRHDVAEDVVRGVEDDVERELGRDRLPRLDEPPIELRQRGPVTIREILGVMLRDHRSRSVLGLSLFVGQAFLYNAVFFTQGLVLSTFFDVDSGSVGLYVVPLALGNFLGPVLLGRYFDTVGRRTMITASYVLSGLFLLGTAWLFHAEVVGATGITIAWCVVFFFASAGASAAYLTVSEIFPMETRAMAIAVFYAVGTGLGGIIGPLLFGKLVDTEKLGPVTYGYVLGAALMLAAGVVEWFLGVDAEGKRLEDVAAPLSARPAEAAG